MHLKKQLIAIFCRIYLLVINACSGRSEIEITPNQLNGNDTARIQSAVNKIYSRPVTVSFAFLGPYNHLI